MIRMKVHVYFNNLYIVQEIIIFLMIMLIHFNIILLNLIYVFLLDHHLFKQVQIFVHFLITLIVVKII